MQIVNDHVSILTSPRLHMPLIGGQRAKYKAETISKGILLKHDSYEKEYNCIHIQGYQVVFQGTLFILQLNPVNLS